MSKSKIKVPTKLKGIKETEFPSSKTYILHEPDAGIDWKYFEEYYKKNCHGFKNDPEIELALEVERERLRRELSEAERREIVEEKARGLARQSYPDWYRSKRTKVEKEFFDRIMESGAPDLTEIEGLASIAKALGYSVNTLKHDKKIKRKLEKKRIIRKGPDGKWRALQQACDAFREGRKKK
jgi:hypothetical protein